MGMTRKEIASLAPKLEQAEGYQIDYFVPDFTPDNNLYNQFDGLNEISIAQAKHDLADIVRMRLREIPGSDDITSSYSDNDILDSMISKNTEIEELYSYAKDLESKILKGDDSKDS